MAASAVSRRSFLVGAGAAAGTLALTGTGHAASPTRRGGSSRRPNIVFILADDLSYGGIGPYGQSVLRTPNLDRLAAEGIAFTHGYSPAPICAPSRCAHLTGKHLGHARVRSNAFTVGAANPRLLPRDTTWAELLKDAGYATGVFGKWGFGDDFWEGAESGNPGDNVGDPSHPKQQGFDEFIGLVTHDHATNGYFPNYLWDGNRRTVLKENFGDARRTYAPDRYVARALAFMRRNRHRTFALYLAPQLVHWPNKTPATEPYTDEPWTEELKRYAAMYTQLDTYVGMVRRQLESLGLAQNTLLVFSSDNGSTAERAAFGSATGSVSESYLGDKLWNVSGGLRQEKHSLYEGGIRVPLIAWGPGIVRARRDSSARSRPWAQWDLLPTFAELAGQTVPANTDGVSVLPWLTGEGSVDHPPLYWERNAVDWPFDVAAPGLAQAGRIGDWKALRFAPTTVDPSNRELTAPGAAGTPDEQWVFELYNVAEDPGETRNLAAFHPELRPKFEELFHDSHVDPA